MIYVLGVSSFVASATELVIAFVMGLGGSINWAMHGMVDIRLTLIILAGSLFGVQLGAIGTTYVKEHMIKIVMGTIMLVVAVSRGHQRFGPIPRLRPFDHRTGQAYRRKPFPLIAPHFSTHLVRQNLAISKSIFGICDELPAVV
jgi:hypothetical protein